MFSHSLVSGFSQQATAQLIGNPRAYDLTSLSEGLASPESLYTVNLGVLPQHLVLIYTMKVNLLYTFKGLFTLLWCKYMYDCHAVDTNLVLIYTTGVNLRFEGLFALIPCKFDCNAVDTNLVLIHTMGVNLRFEGLFALIRCKFDCNAVDTNLVLIYTTYPYGNFTYDLTLWN